MTRAVALVMATLAVGFAPACGDTGGAASTTPTTVSVPPLPGAAPTAPASPAPPLDPARIERGAVIYNAECASCHGIDGQGQPNWMVPNADGSYNAPPHDPSGHTWHHPDQLLISIILDGSDFAQSQMPVYRGSFTEEDAVDVLEYIKTWWEPEQRELQWRVTQQAE